MRAGLLISAVLWALIAAIAYAAPQTPAGTCDALTNAGYVDEDDRLEFVIPFRAEPECHCSPQPCAVVATPNDAQIHWPMDKRPKTFRPPRVACSGVR